MDKDRRAAFLILKDIQDNGSWSNIAIGKQLSQSEVAGPAFVRELVYGILRNQLLLDFNINRFLQKPKLKSNERIILRIGFYQLAFMNVAPHAAINETVALAKSFIKGREGFINAVLRNFQRSDNKLLLPDESNNNHFLSIKYSADETIVKHLIASYGQFKAEEILENLNKPAALAIRVNTLKTNSEDLTASLLAMGFDCVQSQKLPNCWFVKGSGLLDTDLYKAGFFSIQGEESQYAVSILNPKCNEKLMDLCAAPGGKSCACAELMNNTGEILSFDCYEHRVALIEKEIKRLGITIIKTYCADTSRPIEKFFSYADCVLADVPCSALGTAGKNPELKLRAFDYEGLLNIQQSILSNAAKYVKKGGRLLYSTCTLNPLENEKQIEKFLSSHSDWEKKTEKQFFPTADGKEGFYICELGNN